LCHHLRLRAMSSCVSCDASGPALSTVAPTWLWGPQWHACDTVGLPSAASLPPYDSCITCPLRRSGASDTRCSLATARTSTVRARVRVRVRLCSGPGPRLRACAEATIIHYIQLYIHYVLLYSSRLQGCGPARLVRGPALCRTPSCDACSNACRGAQGTTATCSHARCSAW
jgi:hypothetical protein